ncbi:MAG: HlyD family secretion protein [Kiritimatiellia bacterium]
MSITPRLRLRAQTFARESKAIMNPVPWVQFQEMMPEGSRVSEGDTVFQLDMINLRERVNNLENQVEKAENDTALRLAELRRTVSQLEDQRAEKLDQKSILEARKFYLESLPLEADIEIARGRWEVARKNLNAAEEELAKSLKRKENGLISAAMLREDQNKADEQRARERYARRMLDLAELPAHPLEIEIVEFRIRNLELEIGKLEDEIPTQQKILEIESSSQQRRLEELQSQLAERREALTYEFLKAPASGVLVYDPQLKRELIEGGKIRKGMKLAEIPVRESIALEGEIPEQLRHLFEKGDPAEIELNLYPDRSFRGKVHSIAPYSRDAVDGGKSSGVKVVDVVVELEEIPKELPLGVYGWVTLSTQKPVSGWAVPATWIRYRAGKAHVSVGGWLEPVNGILHQEFFVLSSPHPPLEMLGAEGKWKQSEDAAPGITSDQFVTTGELTPFESVLMGPARMRVWDLQIAWLVEENVQVEKGAVLFRLDSERITNELEKQEIEVKRLQGERESAEEQLTIRVREKEFQLGSALNRIAMKERERDLVFSSGSASQRAQSELNLTTARIQLEKAKTNLARMERNSEWVSENEREKALRDLERRTLEVEKAELMLEQAAEGATDVEKSAAELALLKETANAAELEAQHFQSLSRAQSNVRWRRKREEQAQELLERQRENANNMEVTAPVSGLVKYLKVWDGVRQSKIKTGMRVWPGMNLISLSATDKLFVEVAVPERYIRFLKPGLQVSVRIPSEGGMQWNGSIIRMNEILEPAMRPVRSQSLYGNHEAPQEQVLKVRILIETEKDTQLKPGAIAQIIFPFEK